MTDAELPVVLVVEDEPDVSETYEIWLSDSYDVRVAQNGEAALEVVDDDVDVVLLDRMMPRMSGDEVLAEIRARGLDCRVAMVTAVDPDFDIVEMGFDEYVTKPPTREGLTGTVESLLDRSEYADRVQDLRSLVAKRAALQAEKSSAELATSDEFEALEARIESLREELDAERDTLRDDATFVSAIRELTGGEEVADGDRPEGGDDA